MDDLFENPIGVMGIEFVEFASLNRGALEPVFEALGFVKVAVHRSKDVTLYRQGKIDFIINAEPDSVASYFAAEHGPSACGGIAFRVRDAEAAYAHALGLGAVATEVQSMPVTSRVPALQGIGGAPLYLVDQVEDGKSIYDTDFEFIAGVEQYPAGRGLQTIDHLAHHVFGGRLSYWATLYGCLFNPREIRCFDIQDHNRVASNVPPARPGAEGLWHIALVADNLMDTVDRLRAAGVPLIAADVVEGTQHQLPRIYSEAQVGPVFFEFIQRTGGRT